MKKNYVINFDEFNDLVEELVQSEAEQEINNFYIEPYNPENYNIEDYMNGITSEVIEDLIITLEENDCEQFEIKYSDGKVIYYEPVEESEENIQQLWDIVGKDMFEDWTEWALENIIEGYYKEL